MNLTQEDKNKIISASITAVVMILMIVVCMAFGYDPPDPPIPEEGVEVNLGNSDFGSGDNPMPSASEASSAPRPVSATEHVSTQSTEQTVAMNTSDKPSVSKTDNQTPTTTKPEPPKEPEINKNALFSKDKSKKTTSQNAGSEGKTYGGGNQGKPDGDPNSNRYDGSAGKGGKEFSLTGRSPKALPSPSGDITREGKIVVKIWVDRNGNVTNVYAPEQGSNISEAGMVSQAKAAARKAKFSSSDSAPETQTGTITYVYTFN